MLQITAPKIEWIISFGLLTLLVIPVHGQPLSDGLSQTKKPNDERLDHWHQWRGPLANGVAPRGNPPTQWDRKTNMRWTAKLPGKGISTPIVWNGKIFLTYAVETERQPEKPLQKHPRSITSPPNKIYEFWVACFELTDGSAAWKKKLREAAPHEGHHPTSSYAAASPMTDGQNLVVSFGSLGIFCLNHQGEKQWDRDLGDMRTRRGWGEAVSPVISGDKVVVNWDQEDQSRIFVLDLKTGETVWERKRDEPTTWATPLIVRHNGVNQLITNGTQRLRSYRLEDGEILWEGQGTTLNAIPCPVLFRDHVICMAGYRGNAAVSVDLATRGDAENSDSIAWRVNRDTPYVPSPLLSKHRLYFTKGNTAILSCLDARTGEPILEQRRLPGLRQMYASPVAAAGRIYLTSREGETVVLKDADEFEILATNSLNEPVDASPVIVGTKLIIRGHQHLFCIEEN